jgi:6-hydroxytryprostatin B O-methyltransferase
VQDLPATLSSLAPPSSQLPDAIASRLRFQPHDFFTPQPPPHSTADVFFLRKILHDWPASEARQILGHVAAAMKPGARAVVMDTVLPPPGKGPGGLAEAGLRVRDLTMAQSFNGGEREMEDWVRLVEGVRPGLGLVRWEQPKGSAMAMLVLERDGRDT